MTNEIKIAWIGFSAVICAALIAGLFSLSSSTDVIQTTECGAAITNTNGNIIMNANNNCDEAKP